MTASIGITVCPDDATDMAALLKYADTAMHQAKRAGRDTFRFFTSAMNAEVLGRRDLDTALRQAVRNGEFVLHYQPQVDLAGGHVVALEALLRWERPGFVWSSQVFIWALEESDLIVDVGRWVIAAACAQIRDWLEREIDPVPVAVNVSPRQSTKGDHISFIRAITESSAAAAMVMAIIQMGHNLNLKVIAEGVETASQLAYLRQQHCDQIQGFYFSPPLPVEALEQLLRAGANLSAADCRPGASSRNIAAAG